MHKAGPEFPWDQASRKRIIWAARDASRVVGLTHNFYRYPARFSPIFVRSVIEALSDPGDWVIDPFVGGGTTLVEALACGRHALGIDISSLASFVCKAKTLVIDDREISEFERWRALIPDIVNMHSPGKRYERFASAGYYRNLEGRDYWRLRKAIEQLLSSIERLRLPGSRTLARCAVLRCAQWALDARETRPSVASFKNKQYAVAAEMIDRARTLRGKFETFPVDERPRTICLNRSTAGAQKEESVRSISPAKLIVTSPPYPGIHVLYHRWQVDGRKEAPAPFWIAGQPNGAVASYFTMGDRQNPRLRTYFKQLKDSFTAVAAIAGRETTVVQMVAFSDARWQLPKYLEVMEHCGLVEERPWGFFDGDKRLWRDVPNRRWHARQRSNSPGAREVVLVHRKRR